MILYSHPNKVFSVINGLIFQVMMKQILSNTAFFCTNYFRQLSEHKRLPPLSNAQTLLLFVFGNDLETNGCHHFQMLNHCTTDQQDCSPGAYVLICFRCQHCDKDLNANHDSFLFAKTLFALHHCDHQYCVSFQNHLLGCIMQNCQSWCYSHATINMHDYRLYAKKKFVTKVCEAEA